MKKCLILTIIICFLLILVSCTSQPPLQEASPSPPTATTEEGTSPATEEEPVLTSEPTTTLVPPTGELKVHFIDVGQGDSILIDLEDTEILIDGGGKSPGVVAYLNDYVDGALEVVVATHPHADHIGGLIAVLSIFEVEEVWHNGDSSDSKTYSEFMNGVESEGAEVHVAKLHDTIQAGELSLYVHHPSRVFDSTNNNSIVIHLAYGNIDFLFTGDAEKEAEGGMMMLSSVRIPDIEILKVGHHGSRTASSKDFLAITSPEVAIYMAREGNSYGHPHEETIIALTNIGAEIYGTDIHGTIIVITDGEAYTLQLERQVDPLSATTSQPSPPTPTPTEATNVQITRKFYDGVVPRVESDEYVEITNLGSEPVDIAGWVLKDLSEGYPSFTFPSYMLQPGQSVRVYTNEIHPEYGGFSFRYGKAIWNNSEPDTAVLYNAQGREASRKSY